MEKKYDHKLIEANSYQKWLDEKLFVADPNSKKPRFCIVLPPPNITGQLHLGHAWDGTIQDALIRYKRLQGYETLFVPGIDHAGIATQVKILAEIKNNDLKLWENLDQKSFFAYAWKWKDKYYDVIHRQWAKLGLALDYTREKFTLDQDVSKTVRAVFVELYNKKLIYQGTKIVNWDPLLKTAISNIEVNYQEVQGNLYYLRYYLADQTNYLVVATTRPETMFGDQALVVHPKDERYKKFIGSKVINPATQALIPIISDEYVDVNFATGIMKCTPAHDFNDYEIAVRHQLPMVLCLDQSGKINQLGHKYQGLDRFVCRKKLIADLQVANKVEKIEEYLHQVGYSQRTNVVVEPYLSKQWFIKMDLVAEMILKNQADQTNKINFFPEFFENQLIRWVNNIQDWCISRQLWWGHRIPVWYHKITKQIYVALQAPENSEDYQQETDVLDTWFSSALWPLITLNWPDKNASEFKNFYPTSVLVTAYDILFFWVVRMMFMGLQLTNQKPFTYVLIHGLIRDEEGRKMSKSLNNGIDPIVEIEKYGADALRYFLISNSAPGQDLRFSKIKIAAAWNLNNKLWNAARYVLLNLKSDFNYQFNLDALKFSYIDQWILTELNQLISKVETAMENFDFISVIHDLSNFIWDKYCSWYIELSKVNLQLEELADSTLNTLVYLLKQIIIMLHPILPFITEAIYQKMNYQKSILLEKYPKVATYDFDQHGCNFVRNLIEITSAVREIRNQFVVAFKDKLTLHINSEALIFKTEKEQFNKYLLKLTNSEIISIDNCSFTKEKKISKIFSNGVVEIRTELALNKEKELLKFQKQLNKIESELVRCQTLLNNEQFIKQAPIDKVKFHQEKLVNYQKQRSLILAKIKELS